MPTPVDGVEGPPVPLGFAHDHVGGAGQEMLATTPAWHRSLAAKFWKVDEPRVEVEQS